MDYDRGQQKPVTIELDPFNWLIEPIDLKQLLIVIYVLSEIKLNWID